MDLRWTFEALLIMSCICFELEHVNFGIKHNTLPKCEEGKTLLDS
jgi:hypothetical protein